MGWGKVEVMEIRFINSILVASTEFLSHMHVQLYTLCTLHYVNLIIILSCSRKYTTLNFVMSMKFKRGLFKLIFQIEPHFNHQIFQSISLKSEKNNVGRMVDECCRV